jgi:D-alanyl-lipoteichoic acid acyltransferase DltB (MBOAT superfamily)
MITMLLGGLWHGASLKFMLWGGLHGGALAVHKYFSEFNLKIKLNGWLQKLIPIGGILLTFHFVCFCWIFFRSANMEISGQVIDQIVHNFKPHLLFEFLAGYRYVVLLMVLGFVLHFLPKQMELRVQEKVAQIPVVAQATLVTLVILLVVQTKSAGIQPFIYFQF